MMINLIFPPLWECDAPYSSTAYLSAYLKKNGLKVNCCDLNIAVQNYILSEQGMMEAVNRLKSDLLYMAEEKGDYLRKILSLYELVGMENILKAVEILKETKDIKSIIRAKRICEIGRLLYSAPYYPAFFDANRYHSGIGEINDIETLLKAIEDRDKNIFYSFLAQYVNDHIAEYDVWGISIASANQLVPAFTLAKIIKTRNSQKKIVIGGAILPYMYTAILNSPELFWYADCFIFGEGETPLIKWLEYLKGTIAIERIPNIMYLEQGLVKTTAEQTIENINSLDTPDYSDIAWESYFSSQHITSYISSRGCYWNKCSFCGLTSNYSQVYRIRDIKLVLDDISTLVSTDGIQYINFNDEALSSNRLRQLAEGILARNLKFYWTCLCRLDNNLESDLFHLCYKAGLRIISFGLESASETLLKKMNKGIHLNSVPDILKNSHEAGIWNNVYLILGFPGEQDKDINITKDFLTNYGEYIDSLGYGSFRLDGYSKVYKNPQDFGISRKPVNIKYFGPDYPFRYEEEQSLLDKIRNFDENIRHEKYYHENFSCVDVNNLFLLMGEFNKKEIWENCFKEILNNRKEYDYYLENKPDSLFFQLKNINSLKVSLSKGSCSLYLFHDKTGGCIELDGRMELIIEKIRCVSNYNEIINYIEELFPVKPEISKEILKQLIMHLRSIDAVTIFDNREIMSAAELKQI
jgi:hypothetical protein